MYRQMVSASSNRSAELVEEVLSLLRYERETWTMVLELDAKSTEKGPIDANESALHDRPRISTQG
jgi:hypothetical protein